MARSLWASGAVPLGGWRGPFWACGTVKDDPSTPVENRFQEGNITHKFELRSRAVTPSN